MSETVSMRAWRVHEWGQPLDVLQLDTVPIPEPGPGRGPGQGAGESP